MKVQWTIANHTWIAGLNACAEKALGALQLDITPTVRVRVGRWRASMDIKKGDRGCCIVVTEPPNESWAWFEDVSMPTTAEELARALLSVVRSGVDERRDLYTAASEALAAEDGAT